MLPLITIVVMILFTKRMLVAKYTDNNDTIYLKNSHSKKMGWTSGFNMQGNN